jgi:LysR family transcriptional regulator, low CO2-responsive transcriptional regulator
MTPSQARCFLAVALKGSFSEAANSLGVSQPTVTNQIKQIERVHDVELFHRSGRGASLTPVGEALLPLIKRMFGSFEEAAGYLREIGGRHRGQLRIGSYGPYDVIKLVARYSALFPGVAVSVDFSNSQTLTDKLINYELDIAVLGRIKREPRFFALPFRDPPLIAIAPRVPPWAGRRSVSVADLAGQTIVCREPGSAARIANDRLFANGRVAPQRIVQFASREGVVNAVAEGIGIATIFDEGIVPGDRIIKLKIAGPAIRSRVEVVCLADRKSNRLISGFFGVVQTLLKQARA